MYDWDHGDVVAAVASITDHAERCPGCGMTDDDAWAVAAELVQCPTCEDRDRELEQLRDMKSRAGWRARFRALLTTEERMTESSAANYTLAGAEARARWRRERRL